MKITIKTIDKIPTMKVIEGSTTCTFTLAASHDIKTKGDDTKLAERISRAYRDCVGQGVSGIQALKKVKTKLIDGNIVKDVDNEDQT